MNLLLYGFIALAILGTLAGIGYKVRQGGYDACKVEWAEAAEAQRKREAELSAFAAKALADERKRRKVVIQEVTRNVDREVEKTVYRDVCLPATGVCLANAAINGTVEPGCLSDGAVPAAKPSG